MPKFTAVAATWGVFLVGTGWVCAADPWQNVVVKAARALADQEELRTRIRYRVSLLGQDLIGHGQYLQLGQGPRQRRRLELRLQVGDELTRLLQVTPDGTTLWIRRDGSGAAELSYIGLRQLRTALAQQAARGLPRPFEASWLALGGLDHLLLALAANFHFGKPQMGRLGRRTVQKLRGEWKPERLAKLLPEQAESIRQGIAPRLADIPVHLPHYVILTLATEKPIPLFPHRITYHKVDADRGPTQATALQSMMVIELYDTRLRGAARLSQGEFEFWPGDERVEDRTVHYLERWGLLEEDGAEPRRSAAAKPTRTAPATALR